MKKQKFNEFKKGCPWSWHSANGPRCLALPWEPGKAKRHCSKKNCAPLYWADIVAKQDNECSDCEHYGGMKPDCMAPALTPCPNELEEAS